MFDRMAIVRSRSGRIGLLCGFVFFSAAVSAAQTPSDSTLFHQIGSECSFNATYITAPCVNHYRDKLEYLFFQGNIPLPDKMEIGRQLLYSYGSSPADMAAMRAVAHRLSEYHDGTYLGSAESGDGAGSNASGSSPHAWQQFAQVDGDCDIHGSVINSSCVLAHRAGLEDLFYNSDLDLPDKIAIGRKLLLSYSASPDDMRALNVLSERMSVYQEAAAKNAYSRSPGMPSNNASNSASGSPPADSSTPPRPRPSLYGDNPPPDVNRPSLAKPSKSKPTGATQTTANSNPPPTNPNPAPVASAPAPPPSNTAPSNTPSSPNPNPPASRTPVYSAPPSTAPSPARTVAAVSSPPPPPPPATSQAANSKPALRGVAPVVEIPAPTAIAGPSYALIIGIDLYPQFPKLHTAVDDARAVEAILRQKYAFHTQMLLDAQADRGHIMTVLSSYRRTLSPDSNLLVYYAGHGLHDRESDKVYWLPVDAEPDNSANWLQTDDITSEIRAIPARHVLIVADSCYSGGMTRDAQALFTPIERSRFLEKVASAKSRDLLSSGGDEPVADAGGAGGHSVFAAALLRGLDQMDLDRFTAAELFSNYIRVIVAGNSDQTPEYNFIRNSGHDAGDFIFVRRTP
jgi:hypothetical protein